MRRSRVVALATALLCLQFLSSASVVAEESTAGANLDLSSTERTIEAGHHEGFDTAVIQVGESSRAVGPHDLLTPAEHVALHQVLSTGQQSILLSVLGNAVGGTVHITPDIAAAINNLVVPQGVTAIRDFGVNSALNVTGNLTNAGSFYAVSSNAQVINAIINANNIVNQVGALLSTACPAGGLPGMCNVLSRLDLILNAVHDIVNAGTISSSGNLTANAGGSIVNALPSGVTGPQPVMQALNNLNLTAGYGNIVNAGVINSIASSINVTSQTAMNIVVNNIGGTIQALQGSINIRDALFTAKVNTSISGGDILAKELNIFSGAGDVMVDVNRITSIINLSAHDATINATNSSVTLGSLQFVDDPLVRSGGDIIFKHEDNSPFFISNGDVSAIAAGNILADAAGILIGGNALLQAGNSIMLSGTPLRVNGAVTMFAANDIVTDTVSSGSNVQLQAGANISVPAISAGVISGRSGAVDIVAPGSAPFVIGGGGNVGSITINRGPISTGLGFVRIAAGGTGGIVLASADAITTTATSGTPPAIALDAGAGSLTLPGGLISADNNSSAFRGGLIALSADQIFVNGTTLSVSNSGSGPGGQVLIATRTLNTGDGLTMRADGGTIGGDLLLSPFGSLHITVNQLGNVLVLDPGFGGPAFAPLAVSGPGSVLMSANGNTGGGLVLTFGAPISFTDTAIIQQANGLVNGAGGTIQVQGTNINADSSSRVALTANGSGAGSGGVISVETLFPGPLALGVAGGGTNVTARGGVLGGGGQVFIHSAGDLNVDPAAINVSAGTTGGNGGTIILGAGSSGVGSVRFRSPGRLAADAGAVGTGGLIVIDSSDGFLSDLSLPQVNLSARGGTSSGHGGTVFLRAGKNIDITTSVISVGPTSGRGGTIDIRAGQSGTGLGVLFANGLLNASARSEGDGGTVIIDAPFISVVDTNLAISANGAGVGNGGTIFVQSRDNQNALTLGSGARQISLSATSGESGGNGAEILAVNAGGSITVAEGATVDGSAVGDSGNGGDVQLVAAAFGLTTPTSAIVTVNGTVKADGALTGGNGGDILLGFNPAPPGLPQPPGLFVSGTGRVSADGHGEGSGGTITAVNITGGALGARIDGIITASGDESTRLGTLVFEQPGQPVSVTGTGAGTGKIVGRVNASGSSVEINVEGTSNVLTILKALATSGNVTLKAENEGSQISFLTNGIISATADVSMLSQSVFVGAGSVTGQNVLIQTTANAPGDITLLATSQISAGNTATLSVHSTGKIVGGFDHLVAGRRVVLSSEQGNIGASGAAPVLISADLLSAVSSGSATAQILGNVFVHQVPDMPLAIAAAHGANIDISGPNNLTLTTFIGGADNVRLETTHAGDILLAASINAIDNITLRAVPTGNILSNSTSVLLTGNSANLAAGGDIGNSLNRLQVFVQELQVEARDSGSVFIDSRDAVTLNDSSAGNTFSLESVGQITLVGSLSARDVSLGTAAFSNAGIAVAAPVTAINTVAINADGSGDISAPLAAIGLITAPSVTLRSITGNIATIVEQAVALPVFVSTDNLTVKTGGAGRVNISNLGINPLNVQNSEAGNGFSLLSTPGVSLGNVSSRDIITVNSLAGSLTVRPGSAILANEGSIVLTAAQSITLGAGSVVRAQTGTTNAFLGQVFIITGGGSGSLEDAVSIENLIVSRVNGGAVLWGPNQVVANAPTNFVLADGRTVQLDAGSGNITLNGNVSISAIGAVSGGGGAGPGASSFAPGGSSPSNPGLNDVPPPGQLGGGPPPGHFNNPGLTDTAPPGQQLKGSKQTNKTAWKRQRPDVAEEEVAEEETEFKPVSFIQSLAVIPENGLLLRAAQTQKAELRFNEPCLVRARRDGNLQLSNGQILIIGRERCTISVVQAKVTVGRGTVAILQADGDYLKIQVITDNRRGSVMVNTGIGQDIRLGMGEELVIASNHSLLERTTRSDQVGRRRMKAATLKSGQAASFSEFSVVSMLSNGHLLSRATLQDRSLLNRVLKTAAILSMVTRAHGPYRLTNR